MLGIFFTIVAVLLVICIAFYYTDNPPGRGPKADVLFYLRSKGIARKSKRANR